MQDRVTSRQGNHVMAHIYLFVAILGMYPYFQRAVSLASHGTMGVFIIDLRLALTDEEIGGSFGILKYLSIISFAATFLYFSDKERPIRNSMTLLSVVVSTYYAYLATGRTYFFLLIIACSTLYALRDFKLDG